MGIFSRNKAGATEAPVELAPDAEPTTAGRQRKDAPTPTRKEAEAARRERVNPSLSPKEAKARKAKLERQDRARAMQAREASPEKALMRDWIDARRNLGEFLLPSLIVLLALQFLASVIPEMVLISTFLMYAFIGVVIIDIVLMWRGFKKVANRKLSHPNFRGLVMYGAMRATQIRRFRMPAPQVERGHTF
ncbi:DUF3043 domain-containing protein [Propionibacteriaceae bacterium Y2011]|uniref:DUF3043 domain-containing protein n=1 Tax=Microlunatus sp. Y2014 TaxID=3418488 RepID=UPI003B456AA7